MLLLKNLINCKRLAYKNIKSNSLDFFIEKCYRYYSKTYHTPLEEAYKLPVERVCLIFMEDEMMELTSDEMEATLSAINNKLEPVLQMEEEIRIDALDDDAWIAQQNLELKKEEEATKKAKEQEEIIKKTHDAIAALTKNLKELKGNDDNNG